MPSGAEKIVRERQRQITEEGYTHKHDQGHTAGELARAAACYTDFVAEQLEGGHWDEPHPFWPWDPRYWKPGPDEVSTLVKAGALIAAEIDRIQLLQSQAVARDAFAGTRSADGRFPI